MLAASEFELLLVRARARDDEAAWELIARYGPHVVAVVRRKLSRQVRARLDSQDIVQAVWKSFFFDMAGIDEIQSPEQLMKVLIQMTHNKVVDAYRRHVVAEQRGTGRECSLDSVNEPGLRLRSSDPTPSAFAIAKERWQQMIGGRTPVHQSVIRMRMAGETFESISSQLQISERTARRVIEDLRQDQDHDET